MIVYKPYHFGERLQAVMQERHINPTKMARLIGLSHGIVFRMLKRKEIDTEKMRLVSLALGHDFVAEFGAISNNTSEAKLAEANNTVLALQNEVALLKEKTAAQQLTIERMELEAKYLRELVEAYKKK